MLVVWTVFGLRPQVNWERFANQRFAVHPTESPEEWQRIIASYRQPEEVDLLSPENADPPGLLPDEQEEQEGGNEFLEEYTDGFPDSVTGEKTLFKLEEMYSPATPPKMTVSGDIDSLYGIFHSMMELVKAIGPLHSYSIPSVTTPCSADKGSRFSVNSNRCSVPAFVRGDSAKTVPLNLFPNVKVATVPVAKWGCEMHIHLYYLGPEKLIGASYFSHLWMGVVNSLFNTAREMVVKWGHALQNENPNPNDEWMALILAAKEFESFQPLETPVGRKQWRSKKSGAKNVLSAKAMSIFAEMVDLVLDSMAEDHVGLDFQNPLVNGIQPEEGDRGTSLDRDEMVKFAKKLKNNVAFTASIAGCKQHFCKPQFHKEVLLPPLSSYVEMMKETAGLEAIIEKINRENGTSYSFDDDGNSSDDSDIPFGRVNSGLPTLDVNGSKHFPEIVQTWLDDINAAIEKTIAEVNQELRVAFRNDFIGEEAASGADDGDARSLWYIDIGTEFRIGGSVNLFTDMSKSKEFLKKCLTQARCATWTRSICQEKFCS